MAEGRSIQLWDHSSAIIATVTNMLRSGGQPVTAEKIHPHRRKVKKATTAEESKQGFALLKKLMAKE
jgi:hypothetical protein